MNAILPVTPQLSRMSQKSDMSVDPALMRKARELESAFLAEMLSFSGLGAVSEGFGGGTGEEQFASFLRQEHARLIVVRGGIGLAEQIFESLKDAK